MRNTKKVPKWVHSLLMVFGGILMVLFLAAAVLVTLPLIERIDAAPVAGSADWMARLPDDVSLGGLSIPGSHDAGTQYVQLGFFSKCQARSVGQQLEDGFRYLDIRLAVSGDGLYLCHGFCECRTSAAPWSERLMLEDVLEDCYAFLSAHPTETVIFAVKQEYGDESVAEFQSILDRYIQVDKEHWYLGSELPSLGEARGRLILLRRYDDEVGLGVDAGIALIWPNQNGYDDPVRAFSTEGCFVGSRTLAVQDRYEYDEEEKWAAFRAGADDPDAVVLRFLSTKGHMTFGHPYRYAKELNLRLLILCEDQDISLGWTVIDFGNAQLASAIYEQNF
ncbi:MAG: phosphatidylinositol-specific phospholipase C domain-containing protein [Oscillospiraceae bacterium]|nr:phosphatidylinositol-specific phospholipase C domain-containing protein [Oscillospiraceae bacterium]